MPIVRRGLQETPVNGRAELLFSFNLKSLQLLARRFGIQAVQPGVCLNKTILYLHGLTVEMAEAMAEYTHKRISAELGLAGEDDRDMDRMLAQSYRSSRYSFGYPTCPKLEDQAPLLLLMNASASASATSGSCIPGTRHERNRGVEPQG